MRQKGSWKLAVFLLTVILASVIFFQWRSFSSEQSEQKVSVDFSIKHQNNHFVIQQTIHHVKSQMYEVSWPENVNSIKCTTSSGENCKWLNSTKSKLKVNGNAVTFTYNINREPNNNLLVLDKWFIQLKKLKLDKIRIQLSDSQFQKGTWISGGKSIAVKHLDYIDYYVFENTTIIPPLVWTNQKLVEVQINDWLYVYHDRSVNIPDFHFAHVNKFIYHRPVSLYLTTDKSSNQFGNLIILNRKNVSNLESMIIQSYLNEQFAGTQNWLRDIIASAVLGSPVGSKKTQKMYEELVQALKQDELDKWTEEAINLKKEKIHALDLDLLLQKTTGLKTYFFRENKKEEAPFQPLQFLDPHSVKIDGQVLKGLPVIFQNGKRMYPLEKTMSALGYSVKILKNDSIIEIEKPNQQFQFNKNSRIFYYNNEKYGVLTDPIIMLNHQYYMEENWLKQLFKANIEIREKKIELSNI